MVDRKPDDEGATQVELDQVLADYMQRLDRGELVDSSDFRHSHSPAWCALSTPAARLRRPGSGRLARAALLHPTRACSPMSRGHQS